MRFRLFFILAFCSFGLRAQTDSLKYYSKVFKDTSNICDGSRKKAYDYILHHPKINTGKSRWVKKYLGVEMVEKDNNSIVIFYYALECTCYEKNVAWPICDYIAIKTRKKKILRIYGKNFG